MKNTFWGQDRININVVYYYVLFFSLQDIQNLFVAVVKMSDSGDVIKVDQDHLETVIPAFGKCESSY